MLELSIQEAFLRFMACLMKGYKNYLKEVMVPSHTDRKPDLDSTNMQSLFDMQGQQNVPSTNGCRKWLMGTFSGEATLPFSFFFPSQLG